MLEIVGNDITFVGFFTDRINRDGETGLTVAVDVRRGTDILLSDQAAIELGGGLYSYTLAGGQTGTAGAYTAVFRTASDDVDVKHVPALWVLGTGLAETVQSIYDLLHGPGTTQYAVRVVDDLGNPLDHVKVWVTATNDPVASIVAGVFVTDSAGVMNGSRGVWLDEGVTYYIWCDSALASFDNPRVWTAGAGASPHLVTGIRRSSGQGPSFGDLLAMLRQRLQDQGRRVYPDADLKYCLNLAYRETQMASRCHKVTRAVGVLQGQHTYFTDQIFEPIEVSYAGNVLDRVELGDIGVSLESWNSSAEGTPTKWAHVKGSYIRLYPTPSAVGSMTVHGYGIDADMAESTDYPGVIPVGYASSSVLDRAEAEARKMRITEGANATLYGALMQSWQVWVNGISGAVR